MLKVQGQKKTVERDPDFPRWNYPWSEMLRTGDYFEVPIDGEHDQRAVYNRMKGLCKAVVKRKTHMHKNFRIEEVGTDRVRVSLV